MSVPDGCWLLDGPRHVVVGVAEFVGEELDLVWRLSDGIVDDSVASGRRETLLGSSRHEIELVDVTISDG